MCQCHGVVSLNVRKGLQDLKHDNEFDEKTGDDRDCLSPLAPLGDMEEKSPLSIELPVSPENKSHLKKRRSKVSQNFCKKICESVVKRILRQDILTRSAMMMIISQL